MAGYLEGCAHVSFCWIAQDQSPFPILWKLGPVCSLMANLLNVVVVSYMPKLFIPIWHPLNFFFSTGFGSNSSPSRIEICIFLLSTQNHNNRKYGEEQHIRRFSRNHPVIEKQKKGRRVLIVLKYVEYVGVVNGKPRVDMKTLTWIEFPSSDRTYPGDDNNTSRCDILCGQTQTISLLIPRPSLYFGPEGAVT